MVQKHCGVPRAAIRFSGRLLGLCLAMACLMTTALAADATGMSDKAGLIPVSQVEQMVDGRQTLTKVYEVSPATDPDQLRVEKLEQNGYIYTLTSFTRDTISKSATKTVSQDYTVSVSGKTEEAALKSALETLPQEMDCTEDGYEGKLALQVASIVISETGRTKKAGSDSVTKKYTFDYNDDSLVPQSVTDANGRTLKLSSLVWSDGAYSEGSTVPDNYIATARYSRSYTYSVVDGYQATATYTGDVELIDTEMVRYTAIYMGEPIAVETPEPTLAEQMFGPARVNDDGTVTGGNGPMWVLVFFIIGAALVAGGAVLISRLKQGKRSRPVVEKKAKPAETPAQAEDPATAEADADLSVLDEPPEEQDDGHEWNTSPDGAGDPYGDLAMLGELDGVPTDE